MFWKGSILKNRAAILQLSIICIISIVSNPVQSQAVLHSEREIHLWTNAGFPHTAFAGDTTRFHKLFQKLSSVIAKRGELDVEAMRTYGYEALAEARAVNYFAGMVNVYNSMGSGYIDKYTIDSAKYFTTNAIQLSQLLGDKRLLAKSHHGYGWALIYDKSNYDGSVFHIHEGCRLAGEARDTSLLMFLTRQLNRVLSLKGDYHKAYESCLALIDLSEQRKDTSALIYNYGVLARLLSDLKLTEKEFQIVYKALKLKPFVSKTESLYLINAAASNAYLRNEQYDSALYYARLNIPISKSAGRYPVAYFNVAKAHLETNQLDSARFYYDKILQIQKDNGMYINTFQYLDMGIIEFKSGNPDKAFAYYKLAETDITKPRLPIQRDIYKALYEYYDLKKDYVQAFHYLEKFKVMSDSIVDSQNELEVIASLLEKESAAFESQVELLTKDKQLQTALAEKQKQEEAMIVGSMGVVMIMASLAFARWRKNKIIKNKQELLNERLRISRELHDEVGSTLSGVSMFSHLAKDQLKMGDQAQTENSLNIIQKSTAEMVSKLSDIVWLINPKQDTVSELFQRLEEYARQMVSARNMRIQIDIPPELSETHIKLEARRNIYLFFKEAINNAVKYSEGSLLELEAKIINNKIRFSIRDDGKGFDEMTIRRGNGLTNMMKRAEDIGANCRIEARPDKGVNIEMHYKLTH